MVFTGYGDQFRRQRRLMQRATGPQVVTNYQPMLEVNTRGFLNSLVKSPLNYTEHIIGYAYLLRILREYTCDSPDISIRYAGSKTLMIVYGHQVKSSSEDSLLALADEGTEIIKGIASGIGIWPVDIIPACTSYQIHHLATQLECFNIVRHLPEWFPGAGFKRKAAQWRPKMEDFVDIPFQSVLNAVVSALVDRRLGRSHKVYSCSQRDNTAVPSFCSMLLNSDASNTEEHYDIKWSAASMYSGMHPSIRQKRCM